MESKAIIQRVARLAKLEHRDINGQLLAMIDLYEKTYGVSSKITRKRKKKAAPEKEVKVEQPTRKPRSDIGVTRSEEARKNIRIGQLKAKLRRRVEQPSVQ